MTVTSVARHYFRYLNAHLLNTFAGLISFPILARLLNNEQFGILSYWELFPLIWIAFLKLGTQHSIVRYYPIYGKSSDLKERRSYYASLVAIPALVSAALCLILIAATIVCQQYRPTEQTKFFILVLVLGQMGVIGSLAENLMRARELSRQLSLVSIFGRYVELVLALTLVYWTRTASGFYAGKMIAAALYCVWVCRWLIRNCDFHLQSFQLPMFIEGLRFGLPLVVSEVSFILLAYADRLMINQYLPGDKVFVREQLGLYGLGYMLAVYVGNFLRTSLTMAYQPVANRLYHEAGATAVRRFKQKLLRVLIYPSTALAAGLLLAGRETIYILAGAEKIGAAPVFIVVGITYALLPILSIASYGLILARKSGTIAKIVLLSAILNIALNHYLIPRLGIMGAVWATLGAYCLMGIWQYYQCPAELRAFPALREIALPLGAAAVWCTATFGFVKCGVVSHLTNSVAHLQTWLRGIPQDARTHELSHSLALIVITLVLFLFFYLLPCLILDPDLRREIRQRIALFGAIEKG